MSHRPAQTSRRLLQQKYLKRLKARRRLAWLAIWLPAGVASVLTGAVIAASIAEERGVLPTASLSSQVDRLADWTGLGIVQVSISGLRYTKDSEVYAALALDKARTLLGFDATRARQRIELLPWVESVSITRKLPSGLEVKVQERQPIAVWKLGNRFAVIDKSGRPIATVAADAMPGLPRVIGEGAEKAAQSLFQRLAQYPDLAARVQAAERHDTGRWSLQLKHGFAVHLPIENEGEAIARAAVLVASGLAEKGEIDLREGAAAPRPRRGAGQAPAALNGAQKPAGRT